jgi:antirestriction protein ArdC
VFPYNEIIAEKMITLLEEAITNGGLAPWQKSWNARKVNYVTRRPYRGINLWILPEDECEFITFKQIKDLQVKNPDIKIKKGCKKHMVIFWQLNTYVDKKNKDIDLEDETRKNL